MIDLFLGGPLGLWALDQVDPKDIGMVHTFSPEIANLADKFNIPVSISVKRRSEVGFCFHYPDLIKPGAINTYKVIYNIHPALLPFNRSYYPVFWCLWNNEPAGCTLHVIDEGIDTGPIVEQRQVASYEWDTGGTLHKRVSEMEKALFLEYWLRIVGGEILPAISQPDGGSIHYKREFFEMKQRASYEQMNGADLVRLILCLSHEQYTGLEVIIGGRRYEISAREI